MNTTYDVLIVGAGNAALSAAIASCEQGASTLVLEKAPDYFRGGNTYFTGGIIRCAYNGMEDIKALIPDMSPEEEATTDVGKYTEDDFYSDVMRVTEGLADPELAQIPGVAIPPRPPLAAGKRGALRPGLWPTGFQGRWEVSFLGWLGGRVSRRW